MQLILPFPLFFQKYVFFFWREKGINVHTRGKRLKARSENLMNKAQKEVGKSELS